MTVRWISEGTPGIHPFDSQRALRNVSSSWAMMRSVFPFSDFGMTPPSIAGFVKVQDDATLEVLLSLARTGA